MSENRMIGQIDAKRRREKEVKLRKKGDWPWREVEILPDGSERGIEGYVYTPNGADFTIRGIVRWWRSAHAVRMSGIVR